MRKEDRVALKGRTKIFALKVIEFVESLPRDLVSTHLARQLLRSGTSVAANYRAACRARSDAELHSKLCICEEEADETLFWLELLDESGKSKNTADLRDEADQFLSMFVAAKKTLKFQGVREPFATYGASEVPDPSGPIDFRPSSFDLSDSSFGPSDSGPIDLRPSTRGDDLSDSGPIDLRPSTFDLSK